MRNVKLRVGALVAVSLGLTGCLSSTSDDETTINAVADSFSVIGNDTHQLDVLANDEGSKLVISAAGDVEFGTVEIGDGYINYIPQTDYAGIDTFTYSITNDAGEISTTVTVEVGHAVALQGRVIDAPIADAIITLEFNGNTFSTQADAEGRYELPLVINTLADNELVRLIARGSAEHDQEYITLSSRLMTAAELLGMAGSGNSVNRDHLDALQVTQLSTARDFLITRAAKESKVTSDNVAELENVLDPDLVLEMAGVIKLMVDDPDFSLPEGKATIEEFLNDAQSYNEVVVKASEGGEDSPLRRAIEQTLNDPDVMPHSSEQAISGDYLVMFDTAPFLVNRSGAHFAFNEDGTAVRSHGALDGVNAPGRFAYRNYTWRMDGSRIEFDSEQGDTLFETDVTYRPYDYIEDEAIREAYLTYYDKDHEYSVTATQHLRAFHIVSMTSRDLIIRQEYELVIPKQELHIFASEPAPEDRFYLPERTETVTSNSRLVKTDHLIRDELKFENVSAQPWILTDFYGYTGLKNAFNLLENGKVELTQNDHLYQHGSFYYLQNEGWQATWALHDDDSRLRITLRDAEDNLVTYTDFFWHRRDYTAQGLLTLYSNAHGETFASVDQGGPVPEPEVSVDDVLAQLNGRNMLASAVNRPATSYEGTQLKPSDWFGWVLRSDLSGDRPIFHCDGQFIESYTVCEGEFTMVESGDMPLEWWTANGAIHIERYEPWYDRNYCDTNTPCFQRVIKPLRQAENGIIFGMEYNLSNTAAYTGYVDEPRPYYQVEPRFMTWSVENLPGSATASDFNGVMMDGMGQSGALQLFTRDYHRAFPSNHLEEYDGHQ